MRAVDLIRKKRDGLALGVSEVEWLIQRYVAGGVGDDQMAAFAMAVYFRGMAPDELAGLVDAMLRSGDVIDLSEIPGIKVDKHSTGGVGDKVSIALAPLVASCGVPVPMISGRGLGHTGGTLDKLSAIEGFRVDVDNATFVRWVKENGVALIGQTETLAPADRKLYALRDVTGTVESIPLIAASIMSKKLAEGIDALVLDVKLGSGAFMKTPADAIELAKTLISTGERMGRRVRALVTDMNQVIGRAVGNANETWEALEVLRGGGPDDLVELVLELGAEMLVIGGAERDLPEGRIAIARAIDSGRGFECFERCVRAQGGRVDVLGARDRLPTAPNEAVLTADDAGYVERFDVEGLGRAAMILGAGRARTTDPIDPAVGFEMQVRLSDRVELGEPLARVAYRNAHDLAAAERAIKAAVILGPNPVSAPKLVRARLPEEEDA